MRVDLGKQLQFLPEITITPLQLDIPSAAAKTAIFIELTIPLEKGLQAAHEHKMTKYSELVAECREAGWSIIIYPVEVSY